MTNTLQLWGSKPCKSTMVLDKDQVNAHRRARAQWDAYTTGKPYVLYVQNRTISHSFRVQAYGHTPVDAVKRWYRGLAGSDKWKRQCVKVVAVHTCANKQDTRAGDLLMGATQANYPW